MTRVYLGLGTNRGDRGANLRTALDGLREVADIEAVSSVYRSEPVGFRAQPDFWNLVVRAGTRLSPVELLDRLKRIEVEMGRQPSFRNAPRLIDIDILLYDGRTVREPSLEIPHPRMLERAFVLRPLVEIDPDLRHPVTGRTVAEHLTEARDLERVEPLFPGRQLLADAPDAGATEGRRP